MPGSGVAACCGGCCGAGVLVAPPPPPPPNEGVKVLADGLNEKDFALALSLLDFLESAFSSFFSFAVSFFSPASLSFSLPEDTVAVKDLSFVEGSSFSECLLFLMLRLCIYLLAE